MPVVELTIDSSGALLGATQYDSAVDKVAQSTDKATGAVDSLRDKLNKMGPALIAAGTAVGAALVGIGAKAVSLASNLEETQNKFDVVFSGMESTAENWASHLQKNYMMTTEESKRFMASTQDLLKPMGVATQQAGEMSFATAKLAADLGSFNNLETADVMSKIQSALVGNYESVKSLGIVINKTRIETNAYEMGLASLGEELTQAQLATSALDLITKGSADAIGDMARSSGSYALQLKQLKTNITELTTQIGQVLLPYATQVVTMLNDWLLTQGGLNKILNGAIEVIRALYNGYAGIVLILKTVIVAIAKFTETTVKGFRTIMKPFDLLLTGIEKLGGPKNPFDNLTSAVEDFSAASVESLTKSWEKTVSFNEAMDELKQTAENTGGAIQQTAEQTDTLTGSMSQATIQGSELNDTLNGQAIAYDRVAAAAAHNEAVQNTMTETVTRGNRLITSTYQMVVNELGQWERQLISTRSQIIETGAKKNEAAQAATKLSNSNRQASASYQNLSAAASQAATSISSAASAAGSAGRGGGGQATSGKMKGYTRIPEWFTEDMIREYARHSTDIMTQGTPFKGSFYRPGDDTFSKITALRRKEYYQREYDPVRWAAMHGYGDIMSEATGMKNTSWNFNINQEFTREQIESLIAALQRAEARE